MHQAATATATSEVVDFFLRHHHGYPCPVEGLKRSHGAGGTGQKVACFVTPPPVRVGYKCIFLKAPFNYLTWVLFSDLNDPEKFTLALLRFVVSRSI